MDIHNIGNYKQTFDDIINVINHYESNLRNTIFEKDDDESYQQALRRGETLYDQLDEMIHNMTDVMHYEQMIMEFFKKGRENVNILNNAKNEMITKLIRFKKECSNKEDYLSYRSDMNSRRIETPDEKNRRECAEMLEDITEKTSEFIRERESFNQERNQLREEMDNMKREREEMKLEMEKMKKERAELSIKKEFDEVASEYVKNDDLTRKLSNYVENSVLTSQLANYVKQNEIPITIRKEQDRGERERKERVRKMKQDYPIGSEWYRYYKGGLFNTTSKYNVAVLGYSFDGTKIIVGENYNDRFYVFSIEPSNLKKD